MRGAAFLCLRTPALLLVVFALGLVACGTPPVAPSARATAAHAAPPPTALFVPTTPSNGPPAGGVTIGQPPITYTIPAGFTLTLATDQEVKLATSQGVEQILFAVDPSQEDTSHPVSTVTVGGEKGFVLQTGDDGSGLYSEVVIVRHRATQYELSCIGFHGYDRSRIQRGCSTFTSTLVFRA